MKVLKHRRKAFRASGPLDILYVVASVSGTSTENTNLISDLETRGHTITKINQTNITGSGSELDYDVVVIPDNVSSSTVGDTYLGSAIPVVSYEEAITDDMKFTSTSFSTDTGETTVDVIDTSHPIVTTLGLSGTETVYSSAESIRYLDSNMASGGNIVLSSPGNSDRAALFTFDTGATLADSSTAADRRVGLFFNNSWQSSWNTNLYNIIEASLKWAAGRI